MFYLCLLSDELLYTFACSDQNSSQSSEDAAVSFFGLVAEADAAGGRCGAATAVRATGGGTGRANLALGRAGPRLA